MTQISYKQLLCVTYVTQIDPITDNCVTAKTEKARRCSKKEYIYSAVNV